MGLRTPKKWAYLLWVVVFFRCLCPVSVGSGLSLFNAFERENEVAVTANSTSGGAAVDMPSPAADDNSYEYVPLTYPADEVPSEISFTPAESSPAPEAVHHEQAVKPSINVYTTVMWVWIRKM